MLTKILPRLHAALPIGRSRQPLVESAYLALFFAYKRYVEDPYAALTARRPDLFRGGDVLDVGANAGYTASVFAAAVDDGRRVYAFEPEEVNLSRLRRLVRRRRLETRVDVVPLAVGEQTGTAKLAVNSLHPGDHQVVADGAAADTVDVAMTSIDAFVLAHGIERVAFVKIDVQGHELAVSRGMRRLLETSPRIAVAFEYTGDSPDLLAFYRDRGFNLHGLTHRGDFVDASPSELARLQHSRGYADVLASR